MYAEIAKKTIDLQCRVSKDVAKFKCYNEDDLGIKKELYDLLNNRVTPLSEKILYTLFESNSKIQAGLQVDHLLDVSVKNYVEELITEINNMPYLDYELDSNDYISILIYQRDTFASGNISR